MTPALDNTNYYAKFKDYLNELLQSYTRLSELLSQKLSAITRFDVARLDSIIKEEQVFVLMSRGFDTQIEVYREKLSLKSSTLREIIPELPAEYQHEFSMLYDRLKAKLAEVKATNEKCQSLIEDRLHSIQRAVNTLDKSATTAYGRGGSQVKPSQSGDSHILHKSV